MTTYREERFIHEQFHELRSRFQVPPWAVLLYQQQALLIREVRNMKQSTIDMVNAVNGLIDNSAKVDAAIDELVASQSSDDEQARVDAINKLKGLKEDQDKHLAALATAAPVVVAAPPDTAPVNLNAQG